MFVTSEGVPMTYEGGTVSVEDLILCENCVRSGAELLSIEPKVMEALKVNLRSVEADRDRWKALAETTRAAASEWGAPVEHWPTVEVPGTTKRFTPEQKADAVRAVQAGTPIAVVARLVGTSQQSIQNWTKRARVAA